MSRLPRPYIPLAVRVEVAERQVSAAGFGHLLTIDGQDKKPLRERLHDSLDFLFGDKKPELHHRPALVNRPKFRMNGKAHYRPPANDPAGLVYLAKADHDVETRVRGQRGQHSDLGLARKNKNIVKNRDPNRRKSKIHSRKEWPSRSLRSASRLPGKGERPFRRS